MSDSFMIDGFFSKLSEDLVLNIFFKLEDDPRNWARLSCVSTKFTSIIHNICYKSKCSLTIPSVVSDLLNTATNSSSMVPLGGWSSLYKLAVCCPGLHQAGVLLENSDFGLERELGPDENYPDRVLTRPDSVLQSASSSNNGRGDASEVVAADCGWSLFDDLMFDTVYDVSESTTLNQVEVVEEPPNVVVSPARVSKRRRIYRSPCSHLASGVWNLSREQGNKLLASRFKGDCLYICDWPGCIHIEEKRNYMLFRGIFKNFKQSRVWRTINDGNRKKIDLNCAFCSSKQTWDLHSAFCLRRYFGYHDDGEPVVRAYVCENGHVSGAWTDWPLYT
ncbi:phytochrome A-associated F-box protein [Lycium ferocissimum]|uniref:phytochrome A-associated F-box protein n=1 Tax=Lycium ferocissimum TaxID=112874 RepID=UPI002815B520|nr:phytochrome A-associated F-box protein [Lycium ferocissimum]